MSGTWGPSVVPDVGRALEARLPEWLRDRLPIAIYAAGGHTRDLIRHEDFARLNIVGIVDRDPNLHGSRIGPFPVGPVAGLAGLRPALVLVSSTWAHEAIHRELTAALAGTGIQVLDPFAGVKPYAPLFQLAERHGLRLDDGGGRGGDRLHILRPGRPDRLLILAARHWPYAKDVIECFDYYFEAVWPDRGTGTEQGVDLAQPGYHVLRSGARLFFPALPEPEATTAAYLQFARLRPGDTVLDLGAYAGASSLGFARAVGTSGRVLAVEPDPVSLEALRRNLGDHGLAQVRVVPAAVWDQDGEAPFQAEGCLGSSLGQTLERAGNLAPVPTLTLGTLLAEQGISALSFIKMDIEGAETRVLAQALPLLRDLRPRMVVEPHFVRGELNTGQVRAILETGGFRTGLIDQGLSDYPLVTAHWPDR
jgi:FkbM family methyltransferase